MNNGTKNNGCLRFTHHPPPKVAQKARQLLDFSMPEGPPRETQSQPWPTVPTPLEYSCGLCGSSLPPEIWDGSSWPFFASCCCIFFCWKCYLQHQTTYDTCVDQNRIFYWRSIEIFRSIRHIFYIKTRNGLCPNPKCREPLLEKEPDWSHHHRPSKHRDRLRIIAKSLIRNLKADNPADAANSFQKGGAFATYILFKMSPAMAFQFADDRTYASNMGKYHKESWRYLLVAYLGGHPRAIYEMGRMIALGSGPAKPNLLMGCEIMLRSSHFKAVTGIAGALTMDHPESDDINMQRREEYRKVISEEEGKEIAHKFLKEQTKGMYDGHASYSPSAILLFVVDCLQPEIKRLNGELKLLKLDLDECDESENSEYWDDVHDQFDRGMVIIANLAELHLTHVEQLSNGAMREDRLGKIKGSLWIRSAQCHLAKAFRDAYAFVEKHGRQWLDEIPGFWQKITDKGLADFYGFPVEEQFGTEAELFPGWTLLNHSRFWGARAFREEGNYQFDNCKDNAKQFVRSYLNKHGLFFFDYCYHLRRRIPGNNTDFTPLLHEIQTVLSEMTCHNSNCLSTFERHMCPHCGNCSFCSKCINKPAILAEHIRICRIHKILPTY